MAAAVLFAVAGSASLAAQDNRGAMYQRVAEAHQTQSPHYGQMLNRYNARGLSGSSIQPGWEGGHRHWYGHGRRGFDNDRHQHDNGRRVYDNDRSHRG
jgi:hypothetical protein